MFFTADTHFGQQSIIAFANRPFASVEEMDEALIERWNARVQPTDCVYHLGDFAVCRGPRTGEILDRLHGEIHLVWGNDDRPAWAVRDRLASYHDYLQVTVEGQFLILFHYALRIWNKADAGSWHPLRPQPRNPARRPPHPVDGRGGRLQRLPSVLVRGGGVAHAYQAVPAGRLPRARGVPAVTPGGSSADMLARKIGGLVGRYTALSADRRTQATGHKAEASYLYGAAAAFEVVATELWEALGKHGALPRVARASHLSVLATRSEEAPSDLGDGPSPAGSGDTTEPI